MQDEKLTMVWCNGVFMVGKMGKEYGNQCLHTPFIYVLANGQHILQFLPGKPDKIVLGPVGGTYQVVDDVIINLYRQATSGLVVAPPGAVNGLRVVQ